MRHRYHKTRFKGGKDANDMLLRKLVYNFLDKGKLTTTVTKAKVLKSLVEKLVEKSKKNNEANKNSLLTFGLSKKMIDFMFSNIGPALANIKGGYVRVTRTGLRQSDGSTVALVDWVYPIVIDKPKLNEAKSESKDVMEKSKVNKKEKNVEKLHK